MVFLTSGLVRPQTHLPYHMGMFSGFNSSNFVCLKREKKSDSLEHI